MLQYRPVNWLTVRQILLLYNIYLYNKKHYAQFKDEFSHRNTKISSVKSMNTLIIYEENEIITIPCMKH